MLILDSQEREKTFDVILGITNSHKIIIDLSNIDFAMNSHILNQIQVIKPFDK
jgi:glycine/serine hydroxymethyltransferase